MSQAKPLKRVLAIDYGEKWIGLAISDPLQLTAQPLGSQSLGSEEENRRFFEEILKKYEINLIVVGWPLQMNGQPGHQANQVLKFAEWLEKSFNLPVVLWDERLTTRQAQALMHEQKITTAKGKKIEHTLVAVLILEAFLERQRFDEFQS
ncbi:MAG: Holliday junction resolvase RuvX [Candidatus Aminicenantes bacterium]|nr:Holliday junction resolvase RuvX [Candidatus Aminicenantes bacterium]